jgi:hypothetical protein
MYASPSITTVIKSKTLRYWRHLARCEKLEIHKIFFLENLYSRDHSEDLDIDGRIVL